MEENIEKNPEECAEYWAIMFFTHLNNEDRISAWNLLSENSQNKLIDDIYNEIQTNQTVDEESKEISKEHIKTAFENDYPGITRAFWKGFTEASFVKAIVQYATFQIVEEIDNGIVLEINFKFSDEKEISFPLKMRKENDTWKIAYFEA